MGIPFTTIKLDKDYELRLDFSAMLKYEQITGKKISEETQEITPTSAIDFLYVMLSAKDSSLTKEAVIKLLDDYAPGTLYVVNCIVKCINAAVGNGKEKNA
jgi:hypothetical protein